MFHLKQMHISSEILSRVLDHPFDRGKHFVATATWHERRKNLIGITHIGVLGEQGAQHTAATTAKMPVDDADQEPDCAAAGWNINIE